ncbi:hypothetical protein EVAR_36094_1 [Eumeta japonica]|uniref:Uncharacterized protein n=1 Tax=Eumeta variegata TaxID=151549 RepID=A0A4C1YJV8_EUMVA|nr:hypothetical protein EVAR_36094_1 [Eumeta japonica]
MIGSPLNTGVRRARDLDNSHKRGNRSQNHRMADGGRRETRPSDARSPDARESPTNSPRRGRLRAGSSPTSVLGQRRQLEGRLLQILIINQSFINLRPLSLRDNRSRTVRIKRKSSWII